MGYWYCSPWLCDLATDLLAERIKHLGIRRFGMKQNLSKTSVVKIYQFVFFQYILQHISFSSIVENHIYINKYIKILGLLFVGSFYDVDCIYWEF